MARPQKNNADYFPHDNNMWGDRKVVALRNKFGLDGYAIWNLLLESLCESEDFEIGVNEQELGLLADFWSIEKKRIADMLQYMEEINLIQRKDDKISCKSLNARLAPMLAERVRKRKWGRQNYSKDEDGVSDVEKTSNSGNTTDFSTQSKGKKSKENESEEKERKRIFQSFSFEYRISKSFLERNRDKAQINYLLKQNGEEELLQDWADEVRKMKELDKYTEAQIGIVFRYAAEHDFWKDQLMSVEKFRKKNKQGVPYFVVLVDEMKKQTQNPNIADLST